MPTAYSAISVNDIALVSAAQASQPRPESKSVRVCCLGVFSTPELIPSRPGCQGYPNLGEGALQLL